MQGFDDGAAAGAGSEVGESVSVEFVKEGVLSLAEDLFELTVAVEGAGVCGRVEALDERVGAFGLAGDGSELNAGGGRSEADATAATTACVEVTEVGEVIDDFDEVVA